MEEAVAKEGASLVANESFIIGETKDFSSILTKIKDSGAKSIYFIDNILKLDKFYYKLQIWIGMLMCLFQLLHTKRKC